MPQVHEKDLLIAADGGYTYCLQAGLSPDIYIGDQDSSPSTGDVAASCTTIKLSTDKDDTDAIAALRVGVENGFRHFALYRALGGDIAHSIGALQCLTWLAEHGCTGVILHDRQVVTLLTREVCAAADEDILAYLHRCDLTAQRCSFFSFGEKTATVTLRGFRWNLDQAELKSSYPVGISNVVEASDWEVDVTDGSVLAIFER
ncbi:MAG: thiamine diphosphokinase [Coriobacteriaceae bacterium]|nr:thiamine diphosphokinase [Coriobacteriaceae bacterium]